MWYLKDWKMRVTFLYYNIIIMAVIKLWYIAFCSLSVKIDGLLHFLIIFTPMIESRNKSSPQKHVDKWKWLFRNKAINSKEFKGRVFFNEKPFFNFLNFAGNYPYSVAWLGFFACLYSWRGEYGLAELSRQLQN